MKSNLLQVGSAILALTLLISSCNKNNNDAKPEDSETTLTRSSMETEAGGEVIYDDVFNNVVGVNSTVGIGGTGEFGEKSPEQPGTLATTCFILNVEHLNAPNNFPARVTIDFGTSGCTGRDGRIRKGKIITVYTGPLTHPGSVAETYFEGYSVNDIQVSGSHRIENKSTSEKLIFETRVTDGRLGYPNGNVFEWNRTRVITQVDGWGTPYVPGDDVYSVVGNGTGSLNRDGVVVHWTSTNVEPLIKKFSCRWIVKGKQKFVRNEHFEGILDFGNGDCDNKATLTVNGISREITLK